MVFPNIFKVDLLLAWKHCCICTFCSNDKYMFGLNFGICEQKLCFGAPTAGTFCHLLLLNIANETLIARHASRVLHLLVKGTC